MENSLCLQFLSRNGQSEVIDAVYIATPHTEHAKNSILCMENGKAVLCEKPFAVNTDQVSAMIETARQKNILLMEGMWSRFPPHAGNKKYD